MHRHASTSRHESSTSSSHGGGAHRATRRSTSRTAARLAAVASLAIVLPTCVAAASGATTTVSGPTANAATTGVPAGVVLTPRSGFKVTTAGAVIDAADITGTVTIAAPDVVIRNSRIHGSTSTPYGVRVESGSVTVVDSEISGFSYGLAGSGWTAERVEITGAAQDGVKLGSNDHLLDSWVHGLGAAGRGAVDGAQLDAGARDVVLRGNTIDVTGTYPANSAVFVKPEGTSSAAGPLTIDGNWLDGGTATLQLLTSSTGTAEAGTTVTGNHFGRHGTSVSRITAPATASGNVWADTGATLELAGTTAGTSPTSSPSSTPTSSPSATPTSSPTTSTPTPTASPTASSTPTATSSPSASPAPTSTSSTGTVSAPVSAPAPSTSRPGPTNTGVPVGTKLTASGSITVTTPNAVIDGKDVQGTITVSAPGVVVKNSRITGTGYYGVRVTSGDVTLEDTEISGFQNAISGGSWTGLRLNIHSTTQDGVKLDSHVLLQDSWIHDLTPEPGAHADGGQVQSGVVDVVVRHNVIDPTNAATGTLANSALIIKADFGSTSPGPVVIEDNWLNGGNYTLFVVPGSTGNTIGEVDVRNNRFGSTHRYGYADILQPVNASGNVVDATGAPLTIG